MASRDQNRHEKHGRFRHAAPAEAYPTTGPKRKTVPPLAAVSASVDAMTEPAPPPQEEPRRTDDGTYPNVTEERAKVEARATVTEGEE